MSAPTNIYVNRRLRLAATKSAMMIFSKLVVIIIIMDVWIRAFLNIPGGSIYALYKDILIVFLLALTVGLVVTNPKRIVRNKIDYFVVQSDSMSSVLQNKGINKNKIFITAYKKIDEEENTKNLNFKVIVAVY